MIKNSDIFQMNCLLWGDLVSKIDSVLMEIRHLQSNIIRQIREPELYTFLEYEEDYLWGGINRGDDKYCWQDIYKYLSVSEISDVVHAWVVQLPVHKHHNATNFPKIGIEYYDSEAYGTVVTCLQNLYHTRNVGHGWGPDLTQSYNLLASTQKLKLNLLNDKVVLCYWASKTLDVPVGKKEGQNDLFIRNTGRFVTIRIAVIQRMSSYLRRLEDMRAPLERELDSSILDNTRPVTMRRRSQGFYNSCLSGRSQNYHYVQGDLLTKTNDLPTYDGEKANTNIHIRWTHQDQSTFAYVGDETKSNEKDRNRNRHFFVNASFWMSDRPDLCPAVSHEIAHDYIDRIYNDLSESELKYSKGELAHLLRNLSKVFFLYRNEQLPHSRFKEESRELLTEMATDFVAAMRNSHAYLWMLFIEILGLDLFELIEKDDRFIDLSKILEMETAKGKLLYRQNMDYSPHLWSLRLSALCDWVEAIDVQNKDNPYAKKIVGIVREYILIIDRYLEDHTPFEAASGRGLSFLKVLRKAFSKEISSHPVTRTLKEEQLAWIKSSKLEPYKADDSTLLTEKLLPASFQNHLITSLTNMKRARFESLVAQLKDSGRTFASFDALCSGRYYLNRTVEHRNTIMPGLQDVPWVSFMLRGIDLSLIHEMDRSDQRDKRIFKEILTDFYPGYDLYSEALDVHIWLRGRPSRRLARVVRYVGDHLTGLSKKEHDKLSSGAHKVIRGLYKWMTGKVMSSILTEAYAAIGSLYKLDIPHEEYSALALIKSSNNIGVKATGKLNVERVKKLQELSDFFSQTIRDFPDECNQLNFTRLVPYLNSCTSMNRPDDVDNDLSDIIAALNRMEYDSKDSLLMKPVCIAQISQSSRRFLDSRNDFSRQVNETGNHCEDSKNPAHNKSLHTSWIADRRTHWEEPESLYAHLLGRHDLIRITDASNFLVSPNLPKFGKNKIQDINPFSMRVERAFPLLLSGGRPSSDLSKLCATMSITTTGRDCRMDFLIRIFKAWKEEGTAVADRNTLETVVKHHMKEESDLFLLVEGNADILIMFFGSPEQRLPDIFEIQKVVRQDFLVEHVETSFAANTLPVLGKRGAEKYSLSINMRFKSDRNLDKSVDRIQETLGGLAVLNRRGCSKWRRIPGRSDYAIHLSYGDLASIVKSAKSDFNLELLSKITGTDELTSEVDNCKFAFLIDEVNTTIEYDFEK